MILDRDIATGEKQCLLCKETKPLSAFSFVKNVNRYQSRCRPCSKLHGRLEYTSRDTLRAASIIRGCKAYYERHKEKLRAKSRRYYHANREKCIARRKQWTLDNPEKLALQKQKLKADRASEKCHLKKSYGITIEQRDALFAKNGGMCWICSKAVSTTVDHDHETGRIRGALCRKCNAGIGLLGDDSGILLSASLYLKSERTF